MQQGFLSLGKNDTLVDLRSNPNVRNIVTKVRSVFAEDTVRYCLLLFPFLVMYGMFLKFKDSNFRRKNRSFFEYDEYLKRDKVNDPETLNNCNLLYELNHN